MPLTDHERARVRFHLGYGNLQAGTSYLRGIPTVELQLSMLELAFDDLRPEGVAEVRMLLKDLECLTGIMRKNWQDLPLSQVEQIRFRQMGGILELNDQYLAQVSGLADTFQIKPNGNSERLKRLGLRTGCSGGAVSEVV